MERTDETNAGTFRTLRPRRTSRSLLAVFVALALLTFAGLYLAGCSFEVGNGSNTTATTATASTQAGGAATTNTTAATASSTDSTTVTTSGTVAGTIVTAGTGMASPAETVAEILAPSVVNIAVTDTVSQGNGFFRQSVPYQAWGSGVIYTSDGMIITNNHVVTDEYTDQPVTDITVTLTTGEELKATIVGQDPITDLAVLKVSSKSKLPAATFLTELPKVGEYAVAIGSPLNFSNSVTLGIISALDRTLDVQSPTTGQTTTYFGLIQTDTPISPGNSGGALANAAGQVIGINAVKADSSSSNSEGIGFAIPASTVTKIADEIVKTGKATHAYMGVGTQTVTKDMQQQFSLSRSAGILVAQVTQNGPADKAGIQRGDIIINIEGKDVTDSSDLLQAIHDKQPGDQLKLTIDRSGKTMDFTVTLEERPSDLTAAGAAS